LNPAIKEVSDIIMEYKLVYMRSENNQMDGLREEK
jgi:hypothetical protein